MAPTHIVDGDADGDDQYATIQAAIDAASDGAVIEVQPGVYEEELTVQENITLVAPNGATLNGTALTANSDTQTEAIDIRQYFSDTPVEFTIRGFTIVGYNYGIWATETTTDWTIANVSFSDLTTAVGASETTGDWQVTSSTFEDSGLAVNARDSTGDWTVQNSTATNAGGISGYQTTGAWTVRNVVLKQQTGIYAQSSTGDWTVANATIRNAGISGHSSEGNWTVDNTSVTGTDVGINARLSSGDWVVSASRIANNNWGMRLRGAAGDWLVTQSVIANNRGDHSNGISARKTSGAWTVRRSILVNNSNNEVLASGASIRGDARHNWWGQASGPEPLQYYGNVTVSDHLTSRPAAGPDSPDTTPPQIRIHRPTESDALAPGATLEGDVRDDRSAAADLDVTVLLDGSDITQDALGSAGEIAYSTADVDPEAVHTLTVRATDAAGNTASKSVNFTVGATYTAPASLIEYNDRADEDAGDLELVFPDSAHQASDGTTPLTVGGNLTVFHNGRNVTDQYSRSRVTHDGARYVLTSNLNAFPGSTLTVSLDTAQLGSADRLEFANASARVTSRTAEVAPSQVSELVTFAGAPIALNFSTGSNTVYEVTDGNTTVQGPLSSGQNSTVSVFRPQNDSDDRSYNVTVDENGDGFGDTVGATLDVHPLGLTIEAAETRLTTNDSLGVTVHANAIDRSVEIQLLRAGTRVATTSAILDGDGQTAVRFDDRQFETAGNYTVVATDIATGLQAHSDRIRVADTYLVDAVEYDDGHDGQGGDVELVFNRPVSDTATPDSPLAVGEQLRLFRNGANITDRFEVARITNDGSRYVLASGTEIQPTARLTLSLTNVDSAGAAVEPLHNESIPVTADTIDVTADTPPLVERYRGTPIALNASAESSTVAAVVANGSTVRTFASSHPNSSVALFDSTGASTGTRYNVTLDTTQDGTGDTVGAVLEFSDLGLQVESSQELVSDGIALDARIAADASNRTVRVHLADALGDGGVTRDVQLNESGEATVTFGTWEPSEYTIRATDRRTGIHATAQAGIVSDGEFPVQKIVEYDHQSDAQAGDLEVVFAQPATQARSPGTPLALGANITVFLDGRNVTDRFTVNRVTDDSHRYVLTSGTDITPNARLTVSIDNATATGQAFGTVQNESVWTTAVSIPVDVDDPSAYEVYHGAPVVLNFTDAADEFSVHEDGSLSVIRGLSANSTTYRVDSSRFDPNARYNITVNDALGATFAFRKLGLNATVDTTSLTARENLTVTGSANVGRRTLSVQLRDADGRIVAAETVVADADGVATVDFGEQSPGDYVGRVVDVDTGLEATSQPVSVTSVEPAHPVFNVSVNESTASIVEGETVSVTATVENNGTEPGTQTVSLAVAGQRRDERTLSLAAGEARTTTLSWSTAPGDAGTYDATVATQNDTTTAAINVLSPATFAVDIQEANSPVRPGEQTVITASVSNTGEVQDSQQLTLVASGTQRDATTVTLDAGDSTTVTLTWNTTETDAGDQPVVVASADDSATTEVLVQADTAPIAVTNATLSDTTITAGEPATVTATVRNNDTAARTLPVSLEVNGSVVAEQPVTVPANTTNTTTLQYWFDDPGTYSISVNGTTAGTLTVEPATQTETGTRTPGFGVAVAITAITAGVLWRRTHGN